MKHSALIFSAILTANFMAAAAESNVGDSISLSDVVVTGTNRTTAKNLLPYTVSVVSHADLEATGQTQVLAAISGEVPSLFVTQRSIFGFGVSNGGSGHIKMRGVGGDRASGVLMMVDGQPQFAGIYSHHIADFYGKESVERVEVLRGPGSVLYGSNAMAGVINVVTRNPRRDGIHTTLTTQYGSYNTWLTSATNTVRAGRFSSMLSLSYNRTDGNIKGMDFKEASGYGKIGYELSDFWKLTADYTLMNFKGNDPVYPRLRDPESTAVYSQNITRGEASVAISDRYASTSGNAQVYYSYGNHYIDDPNHFHSLDDRFGILAYQNVAPWTGADMTLGFDFNTYTGRIPMSGGTAHKPGSMGTISRKSITEYSPYLTLSQTLFGDILVLNGGLRMANSDKFSTEWIPQAGFVINPGAKFSIKGSVSKGYRNPSFRELYLYRMANPDLEPERMMNYEVSVARHFSRYLTFDLTFYYCKGDNMIQVEDNKNVNTGRFINKGIEVSVRSNPLDNLSANATYSYLHTSLSNLTGAPVHQFFFGVNYRPIKRLDLSADVKYTGRLYVHESVKRQNYALLNLKADYELLRYAAVFVRLENITDTHYVINRGYDMPGFTAMGGLRLSF